METDILEANAAHPVLATSKKRLALLVEAWRDQIRHVDELLAPLGISPSVNLPLALALKFKLPHRQTLVGYEANLFRDWAWGEDENNQSLALLKQAVGEGPKLGKLLVLGAGGGRLAYDLHRWARPELTLATDTNPLLLLALREICFGEGCRLVDFPIAPLSAKDAARESFLKAPASPGPNFRLAFVDARFPPFPEGTFDTLLTPWLLDILGGDTEDHLRRLNGLLRKGGRWVHFGPFGFTSREALARFSPEEMAEMVERCGFRLLTKEAAALPYLQSPHSHHGRREWVHAWVCEKMTGAPAPNPSPSLPSWLENPDEPIPRRQELWNLGNASAVQATLIGLVDGARTLNQLAQWMVDEHGMELHQSLASLRLFFQRMNEETEGTLFQ